MSIENIVEKAELLDYYGMLLTARQRECLDLYYNEIAEYFHISRQAVHDAMRHGEEQLAGYEKALRMLSRKKQKAKAAEKLLTLLTDRQKEEAAPLLELLAE